MIYLVTNQTKLFKSNTYELAEIFDSIAHLSTLEWIGVDTETQGFDPFTKNLYTIQLGDRDNQYVIDLTTISINYYKSLLESKNLILQNAKFDLRFLYKNNIVPKGIIWDTFLAEVKLTQGQIGVYRNLGALAKKYCNTEEVDKGNRGLIHYKGVYDDTVINYCAKDVAFLHEIKDRQYIQAIKLSVIKAIQLECEVVKALAYVEFCGIYLDRNKWQSKVNESQKLLIETIDELNQYIINTPKLHKFVDAQLSLFSSERTVNINWASDKDVKKLFKEIGINILVTEKGVTKESVESTVLLPQKDKFPILPIYLKYSKLAKEISTYGESFLRHINPVTNRVHTSFTQIVNTGRMASGSKQGKEESPNLQNIPADDRHRQCFVPQKEENILIDCDYTGMENVIMTNISKDPNLIEFFRNDLGDLHSFVASKIYPYVAEVPLDQVKKLFPKERQNAKAGGFCFLFGGTGYTAALNLNISRKEGEELEKTYFEAFPSLKYHFDKVEKEALEKGYILIDSTNGSKWFIDNYEEFKKVHDVVTNLPSSYWEKYREERGKNSSWYQEQKENISKYYSRKGQIRRNAINAPVQGSSATITKKAVLNMYNYILENNLFNKVLIVNVIHDEILLECPKELANNMAQILKQCMEDASKEHCTIVPLKAEPIIVDWWQH